MAEQMSIGAAGAKKICYYVTFKAALRSFVCKEVGAMYLSRAEFLYLLAMWTTHSACSDSLCCASALNLCCQNSCPGCTLQPL